MMFNVLKLFPGMTYQDRYEFLTKISQLYYVKRFGFGKAAWHVLQYLKNFFFKFCFFNNSTNSRL